MNKQQTIEQQVRELLGAEYSDYDLDNNNNNLRGIQCEAHVSVDEEGEEVTDIDVAVSPDTILAALAEEEIEGGYWEDDTTLTQFEEGGIFNVMTTDRWSPVTAKSESQTASEFKQSAHLPTVTAKGSRGDKVAKLDSERNVRRQAQLIAARASFGIADIIKPKQAKKAKVRKVTAQQRRFALMLAKAERNA